MTVSRSEPVTDRLVTIECSVAIGIQKRTDVATDLRQQFSFPSFVIASRHRHLRKTIEFPTLGNKATIFSAMRRVDGRSRRPNLVGMADTIAVFFQDQRIAGNRHVPDGALEDRCTIAS